MATRKQKEEYIDHESWLRMPKTSVLSKIDEKIKAIDDLTNRSLESMEFDLWRRNTEKLLSHAFGPNSKQVQEFTSIHYYPMVFTTDTDFRPAYLHGLQSARGCLMAIVNEINEFCPDDPENVPTTVEVKTPEQGRLETEGIKSRRVFVVHGHDEGMKSSVARFLEKLDLQPIILHEQPNGGKTIIEKFETNADVAFAVVLMSPDDEGREKAKDGKGEIWPLEDRARQNVILELGYFIGRLGRSRVCALRSGEMETPSDVLGVLYVPYDSNGGWKIQLVKELQEARIAIDTAKCAAALMA